MPAALPLPPRIRYAILHPLPAIGWPTAEHIMTDDVDAALAAALSDPPRIQRVRVDPKAVVARHRRKLQELAQQGQQQAKQTEATSDDADV